MLCPKCDTQNRDNAKFCKVCGYAFTAEDVAANHAASTSTPATDTQSASGTQDAIPSVGSNGNDGASQNSQEAQVVEVVVQP